MNAIEELIAFVWAIIARFESASAVWLATGTRGTWWTRETTGSIWWRCAGARDMAAAYTTTVTHTASSRCSTVSSKRPCTTGRPAREHSLQATARTSTKFWNSNLWERQEWTTTTKTELLTSTVAYVRRYSLIIGPFHVTLSSEWNYTATSELNAATTSLLTFVKYSLGDMHMCRIWKLRDQSPWHYLYMIRAIQIDVFTFYLLKARETLVEID